MQSWQEHYIIFATKINTKEKEKLKFLISRETGLLCFSDDPENKFLNQIIKSFEKNPGIKWLEAHKKMHPIVAKLPEIIRKYMKTFKKKKDKGHILNELNMYNIHICLLNNDW